MTIDDVAVVAASLTGVRHSVTKGRSEWRYHGRLVARQLDGATLVVRCGFEQRDLLLRRHPDTFSVPTRFAKHRMIVCDLARGDAGAIEDALHAAWELQRRND